MEDYRAVYILILSEDKTKFLSVSDKFGKNFNLPGGFINKNESYINGLNCKLEETTGLIVLRSDLQLLYENNKRINGKKLNVRVYIALNWRGDIYEKEICFVKWLSLEEFKTSEYMLIYNKEVYKKLTNKYNSIRKLYIM